MNVANRITISTSSRYLCQWLPDLWNEQQMQGADVSHPTSRIDICGEEYLDQGREAYVVEPRASEDPSSSAKG